MKIKHTQLKDYGKGTQISLNQAIRLSPAQLEKNIEVGTIKLNNGTVLIAAGVKFYK